MKGEEAEHHLKDFEWEELRREVETDPSHALHLSPFQPPPPPSSPSALVSLSSSPSADSQAWSHFHSVTSRVNSSRANEKINVYACDCSVEALERAKENLENAGLLGVMDCFHPFYCDFSATQFPKWLVCGSCRNVCSERFLHCYPEVEENGSTNLSLLSVKERGCCLHGVDFVTLIFTLSAVPPERMPAAIKECFSVLKLGGQLFFRDYGLYDMTMLRFEPDKRLGFNHYMRVDGTYSYFFYLDDVRDLFVGAGVTELELEYCCVKSVNRQKGKGMRRVWIHRKFQKPL